MRRKFGYLVATGFALTAINALAYADDTTDDIRCVASALALTGKADATNKGALAFAAIYYIGRLDGRVPSLALEDALVKELSAMTPTEIGSEAVRCGKVLNIRGQQITQIGEHMIERGKSPPPDQPKGAQ